MESGERREYSIGELADEAGVSTRTIRYYVSEGLLPPPVGAGPRASYTDAHREQLEIIGRLKAQYLPLKEIRRRLIGHAPLATVPPPSAAKGVNASELPSALASGPPPEADHVPMRSYLLAEPDLPSPAPMAARFEERAQVNSAMPPPAMEEEQSWRRVAISDEAELMITESQYHRHRDKIDWLVQWAKRVLDG
jgi:hypothetical protein